MNITQTDYLGCELWSGSLHDWIENSLVNHYDPADNLSYQIQSFSRLSELLVEKGLLTLKEIQGVLQLEHEITLTKTEKAHDV